MSELQVQEVDRSFMDLISKTKKDTDPTPVIDYIQNNNINLCQISSFFNHCLLGALFIQSTHFYKKQLKSYLKTVKSTEVPKELFSPWVGASTSLNNELIKMLGKIDTTGINDYASNTGFGSGTPISILIDSFYREKSNPTSKNLEKFLNGPFKTMLDFGADVNQFACPTLSKKETHATSIVFNEITAQSEKTVTHFLSLLLDYNFQPNKIYDKETQDNFFQFILSSDKSSSIICSIIKQLTDYGHNIDFSYKNKKGHTFTETYQEQLNTQKFSHNNVGQAFLEQLILKDKLINNEKQEPISKKRL